MTIPGIQLIALAALTLGQNPAPRGFERSFEVASIKPHRTGGDSSDRKILPGGRFVGSNVSVRTMIRIALGVEDQLISGGPRWMDSETYDIDAKTGGADITPEQFPQLILALLEERFQLRFHRETKESPVFRLEVAKNGPKLTKSADATEPSMSTNSRGTGMTLKAARMSMESLAAGLKRQTGRAVEDHTGLDGEYDFELAWDRDETADSFGPSMFTALQEQLGLKLSAAKGLVGTIVIDRVERPSEN